MSEPGLLHRWNELHAHVNGSTTLGQVGVRDPDWDVLHLLERREVLGLGITTEGAPVHPLYQRADVEPRPYWRELDHA